MGFIPRILVALTLLAGACQHPDPIEKSPDPLEDPSDRPDLFQTADLSRGSDLGSVDLRLPAYDATAPGDLSPVGDLAPVGDLSHTADLAPVGDLGQASHCGSGALKWAERAATKLSTSSGNLQLHDVSVRPDGEIWVTGALNGPATFGEGTPYQTTLQGCDDILVARYAADGSFRWGRIWQTGYNSFASGTHIRALADGGAIVAASFYDTVTLDSGLATQVSFTAAGGVHDYDMVLVRLAADGHVVWARHAGGAGADFPQALDVLPDGRVSFVGRFADAFAHDVTLNRGRPDARTLTVAATQWEDLFIAQYDAQGGLTWVRLAGGTSRDDSAAGALYLGDGSVVVSGSFTRDISFEVLAGSVTGPPNVSGFFVARWLASGAIAWARVVESDARGSAVAQGPNGSLWVLVQAGGSAVFGKGEPTQTSLGSGGDAIARYDTSGAFLGIGRFATSNALHYLTAMVVVGDTAYVGGDEYYDITLNTAPPTTVSAVGWQDALALCTNGAGQVGWWRRAASSQHDHVRALAPAPGGDVVAIGEYDENITFSPAITLAAEALFSESFVARYGP